MGQNEVRVYFRSLFEALAAVHKHGIIHRDIKPTYAISRMNCSTANGLQEFLV